MSNRFWMFLLATPLAWGCASSFPEPKQPLADAESASRSAREVGSDAQPAARLQVKLADEQIAAAKALIADGDNERASYVLLRARADAELGLSLARESRALGDRDTAVEASSAASKDAAVQGVKP